MQHLFHQLTAGLLAAHSRGIAHRDLKLENVLLSEDLDTVEIADFGLGAMTSSVRHTLYTSPSETLCCLGSIISRRTPLSFVSLKVLAVIALHNMPGACLGRVHADV